MVYWIVPFSMTLNNPKPRFQGQAILWRRISPKWLKIRPQLLWKANRKPYPYDLSSGFVSSDLELPLVILRPMNALNVLCAQLTRDLFAIANCLFTEIWRYIDFQNGGRSPSRIWKFSFLITWRSSSSKSAAVYKMLSKLDDFYRASAYWRAILI